MCSAASFIDRRKSFLRAHPILALLTHFITHKSTISGVSSTNRAYMGQQFRANVTWVGSSPYIFWNCVILEPPVLVSWQLFKTAFKITTKHLFVYCQLPSVLYKPHVIWEETCFRIALCTNRIVMGSNIFIIVKGIQYSFKCNNSEAT